MHKNIKGEITRKVLKRKLSFLNGTYRHGLFYITVKYSNQYSNYRADTKMFTDGWNSRRTDARLIAIFPEPLGRGTKRKGNACSF